MIDKAFPVPAGQLLTDTAGYRGPPSLLDANDAIRPIATPDEPSLTGPQ